MTAKVIVVDRQDEPLGLKTYDELRYEDIYRVSALWLSDGRTGDVLLAQRKWTKTNDPGKWTAAVAGTIEEGETYEQNIVHETEEEIGLKDVQYRTGPKQYIDDGKHRFFCQWYLGEVDKNEVKIVIQEDEVEAVKWVSKDELVKWLQDKPEDFTPSTKESLAVLGVM